MAKKFKFMEYIIRETTEIELPPDNRKEGFSLCKSWKPIFQTLKE
jgi:hypothetical protein